MARVICRVASWGVIPFETLPYSGVVTCRETGAAQFRLVCELMILLIHAGGK